MTNINEPPPIQTPPPPRPVPERSTTNGLALASLILGIVGFLINPLLITSIFALVLGIIALRRAPVLGRRNMAIIGIVLSIVSAIVGVIVFSSIVAGLGKTVSESSVSDEPSAGLVAPSDDATTEEAAPTESTEPSEEVSEEPAVPTEYVSALEQAQSYSDNLHLSKDGIYDQLISDYGGQFPKKAAKYAIAHVDADWNANALAQAESYQENLHLSRSGIHDQLTSHYGGQFTDSQADYALAHLEK